MKRLRKIIFWCHLPIGVLGGVVILIMCVTGVLLTYEKQITYWADTKNYQSPPPTAESKRLPVETLIAKAKEGRNAAPTAATLRNDPAAPVEIAFGREGSLFLNAYTGQVLGGGSQRTRSFFRGVTDWHRWLGAQGENRNTMRAITGACNLGFLVLVISGFYLWFPQKWSKKFVRNIAWFKRGLPSKARDFNWHNVIGFWSAVPLLIVVLSAVVISYTWAGNLVYKIVGETPPAPRANQPQPGQNQGQGQQRGNQEQAAATTPNSINTAWAVAEQQVGDWNIISLQLSAANAPLTFNIDRGNGGQPQKRGQLTVDRTTGQVTKWEPFSSNTRGRQLRTILRFAHTGEVLGLPGQTIAGIVSAGGAVLVWTGLALAFRRLRAWRARRAKAKTTVSAPELVPNSMSD
jgi:uncharacterized iron-regulated membrane protein